MNEQDLADCYTTYGQWFRNFARDNLNNPDDLDSALHDAFVAVLKNINNVTDSLAGYVRRTLYFECMRLNRRRVQREGHYKNFAYEQRVKTNKSATGPIEVPDHKFISCFLPEPRDRELFMQHYVEGRTFKQIGGMQGRSEDATKQAHCRMKKDELLALKTAWCFASGSYERVDEKYQFSTKQAELIAQRLYENRRKCPEAIDGLYDVLSDKYRHLIDAPKNSLGLLRNLNCMSESLRKKTERAVSNVFGSDQFRGLKVRALDTLVDVNAEQHLRLFRNEFSDWLVDMADRARVERMPDDQVQSPTFKNLSDNKDIVLLGEDFVSTREVDMLGYLYLHCDISFDLRRSINFFLQRLHPENDAAIDILIRGLDDEWDLPNACYLVHYLLSKNCKKYHPKVYRHSLAGKIERLLGKPGFSESAFLKESVEELRKLATRRERGKVL